MLHSLVFLLSVSQGLASIPIGTIDRFTGVRVSKPWLEAGFTLVDDNTWTKVRSVGRQFSSTAVILTALPDLGGRLYTQGNATATRIRNLSSNSSGVFFEIKVRLCELALRLPLHYLFSSTNLMITSATKLPSVE
jgi:hypothetical protein